MSRFDLEVEEELRFRPKCGDRASLGFTDVRQVQGKTRQVL